ncbi:uncharacterized protein LOC123467611 isoform X2 [Daphnia magna]|uniref:uncharacterized protein LOC123467611 isoform X2 n=1 Tax=Daphnia magna TaxID=35525 RepID=UPI001E1BD89A|nr:uncharacterized protein LOC123467611 isoform X2 [Daphnia magna]
MPLPPVINLDDEGNCLYVHFGLENALCGDSVGIYRTNPEALPFCLRNKIYKMDKKVEVEQAKAFLQGRRLDDTDNAVLISRHVTHFEVDLSADGVQFFDNSEQSECIPICMIVHSVSESTDLSKCKRILLKVRKPVIIGVAHCKTKPDVKKFLAPLIQELVRLDPTNLDDQVTAGRQFTVSIRCIIADWPMRSYLKRIKGHSGYWSCERCIQEGVRCIHHPTVPLKSGEEPKTSIQFFGTERPQELMRIFCHIVKAMKVEITT